MSEQSSGHNTTPAEPGFHLDKLGRETRAGLAEMFGETSGADSEKIVFDSLLGIVTAAIEARDSGAELGTILDAITEASTNLNPYETTPEYPEGTYRIEPNN